MFGTGSRFFFALALLGFVGAGAYGIATGGDPIGVVSMGYKGGVGEHFGYTILTLFGATSLVLAVISVVIGDADPAPVADGADVLPEIQVPATVSPWPLVGAVGLVITVLGLVEGWLLFVLGIVVLGVTAVEWAVQVWADRATGDPAVNRAIRNRFMAPVEVPLGAALVIAFIVIGLSRLLLAVSATAAWIIASCIAGVILLGAVAVLARPKQAGRVATVLVAIGALAVVAAGIAGVAAGEREFHHEEPGHEAEEGSHG